MNLFTQRLKILIEQSGKSQNKICEDLRIKKQKLSKWKTGYNQPNLDDLVLVASYFDVSTDYLLGYENEDGSKNINTNNN